MGLCDAITSNPLEDFVMLDEDCVAVLGNDFEKSEENFARLLFSYGYF